MADVKRPDRVLPDAPEYRPLERFWPYADLSEQPSDEELAKLHPEIAAALARASDEYVDTETGGVRRHRARFFPGDRPARLRDLYELVADVPELEVLVDDRPVPYARELWLPLVWYLIS